MISTLELSSAGEDIGITKDFNEIFVNSGGIQKIDASDMQIPNETLVEGNFYSFNFDAVGNQFSLQMLNHFHLLEKSNTLIQQAHCLGHLIQV